MNPECPDLDLSLVALNIEEPRSGIGLHYSIALSTVEHASSSIFDEDDEDDPVDY